MRGAILALALAALGGGCNESYVYRPEEGASARVGAHPAAYYPIPPEAPQGDVRVASFGVSAIHPEGDESHEMRAMHARIVVTNQSPFPWTVDTRQQVAAIAGVGNLGPLYASTPGGALPLVGVPPNTRRTIDLFYPLPPGVEESSQIPAFDLLWRVDTGNGRVVAERTPFDRLQVEPATPSETPYHPPGWGPSWWSAGGLGYGSGYVDPLWVEKPVVVSPPTWTP
jgi:hypothetical protein